MATTNMKNEGNAMSIVAYLWWIGGLIVLLTAPKGDKFLKFHAWQSICLSVLAIVVWFVWSFISGMILAGSVASTYTYGTSAGAAAGLGILSLVSTVVNIAFFVLWLICVIKAYKGEMYKLPVIGDFAEKQAAK